VNRLSVLIPVFNNATGLERSLHSLRQAESAFDVLIVDDGSHSPIAPNISSGEERRVRVLRLEPNRGIAGALNHGLRHLLAEGCLYAARLDAGDTVAPGRFAIQAQYLDFHPDCAVVSSHVDFVDVRQRFLFRYRAPSEWPAIRRALHLNNCVMHPACTLRLRALETDGLYREDVPGAEDYELFLRLARLHRIAILPEVLTYLDYSPSGISIAGRREQQRQRLRLQLRYFDPACAHSFYGIARTLAAMLAPGSTVLRWKRALSE